MAKPPLPPPPVKEGKRLFQRGRMLLAKEKEFFRKESPHLPRPHLPHVQKAKPELLPPPMILPMQRLPVQRPFPPIQQAQEWEEPAAKGPPVFIKIEKYREVVNQLHHLKTFALSLRDALDALSDIEKELSQGISLTHRALDKFNSTIATLDSKITRLPPTDVEETEPETQELQGFVQGLNEKRQRLQDELQRL